MSLPFRRAAILLSLATAAGAQTYVGTRDARIGVGSRVRFARDTATVPIEGRVLNFVGDTMDVGIGSSLVRQRVSLREVARLEVHRRQNDVAIKVLGATGFVAGAATYINWCLDNRDACRDLEERERRERERNSDEEPDELSVFGASALGGFLVGAALGYLLTPPGWERIERPVNFGVVPTHRGVMVYASIRTR